MSIDQNLPLIPGEAAEGHDRDAAGAAALTTDAGALTTIAGPDGQADEGAADWGAPPADEGAAAAGGPPLPKNATWRVTPDGLEAKGAFANGVPMAVSTFVPAERLLAEQFGMPGVSHWGVHFAKKPGFVKLDDMLEALERAIEHHHPGQTTIDVAVATTDAARREFYVNRARVRQDAKLGYLYEPGEGTERRTAAEAAWYESYAWTTAYPAQHAAALRVLGMNPADHPAAHALNLRVVELAASGLWGAALRDAADSARHELITHPDPDPESLDDDVAEGIEWEAEILRGK